MAGAKRQLGTELSELKETMALCREFGVIRLLRSPSGSLEMVFGPPMSTNATTNGAADPNAKKRAHYANLLNRYVSDEELKHLPDGG